MTRFTDNVRYEIEAALSITPADGKTLRLASHPGVGRNHWLQKLLKQSNPNVYRLEAFMIGQFELERIAESLAATPVIIIDGFNHASRNTQRLLVEMITKRTVTAAPVKHVTNAQHKITLRPDVQIIVSDSIIKNETNGLISEVHDLFETVAIRKAMLV